MSKFIADKIFSMTDENGNVTVCLTASSFSKTPARMTVEELKQCDKGLTVEVKPYRSARSLRQNAMLWALVEKIASEQSGGKRKVESTEAYCDVLEQANCVSTWCLAKSADEFRNSYRAVRCFGTREVTDKEGEIIELNLYKCYVGSSKFTTEEMTELIECALDICADLGINDSETELARRTYEDL